MKNKTGANGSMVRWICLVREAMHSLGPRRYVEHRNRCHTPVKDVVKAVVEVLFAAHVRGGVRIFVHHRDVGAAEVWVDLQPEGYAHLRVSIGGGGSIPQCLGNCASSHKLIWALPRRCIKVSGDEDGILAGKGCERSGHSHQL